MLIRILAIVLALAGTSRAVMVNELSQIQYWAGSGTNQAAMVIQWNDGKSPVSLAWGFRWDGIATGFDMIQAIDAADSHLSFEIANDPMFGKYVTGIFLDTNGNGSTSPAPSDILTDSTDRYKNGFTDFGFWGYNVGQGSNFPGTSGTPDWAFSDFGVDSRVLSNQSWDAWNYTVDFMHTPAIELATAAVPEPRTALLLIVGAGVLFWRIRQSSCAQAS